MDAPDDPVTALERTAESIRRLDAQRILLRGQVLFSDLNSVVQENYSRVAKRSLHAAWVYARHTGRPADAERLKDALVIHLELDDPEDMSIFVELMGRADDDGGNT